MPSTAGHSCRPIWIAGSIRATCNSHWWQLISTTGVPVAAAAGAQ